MTTLHVERTHKGRTFWLQWIVAIIVGLSLGCATFGLVAVSVCARSVDNRSGEDVR